VSREFRLLAPKPARCAAAGGAAALLLAGATAVRESLPEVGIYDGYWMLLGATLAVAAAVPLVWRWPRQRSLPVVVVLAVFGAWAPIAWLALRRHSAVLPRLKGTWYLMGGDVIGAAIPVAAACLWFAFRGPGSASKPAA
jgi:hypothetical protein